MRGFFSRRGFICLLGWALYACGGGEPDKGDELGNGQEEEGRYELVIVEAQSPADRAEGQKGQTDESAPIDSGATASKVSAGPASGGAIVYDPQGEFTVQVGVYPDARTARQIVRELSAEGYPAYLTASRDGKGVRVRIGYFRTREEALRFGQLFKEDRGVDTWVDRKANER